MSVILTKRVLFVSVKAPKIVHETKRVNSFDKTEKIKCQDLLTRFNYINDLFFYKEKKEGNLWQLVDGEHTVMRSVRKEQGAQNALMQCAALWEL